MTVNTQSDRALARQGNVAPSGLIACIRRFDWSFYLVVALPTLLSVLYFGVIASDVYVSESRFVIRGRDEKTNMSLGALLKGTDASRSTEDAYAVQDYVQSRDALQMLEKHLSVRGAYSGGKASVFDRFPGLDGDNSFEMLYRYYRKMVDVQLDSTSSIAVLSVRAFDASDAFGIDQKLLEMSEALVNLLNKRAQQDAIRFASGEVDKAEERARRATLSLARYRNGQGVIDPEQQAAIPLQQISRLQDELVAAKVQREQLRKLARNSPQMPAVESRIEVLESEIASVTNQVTGNGRSLATKAAAYQLLLLEKEFADKQLGVALASLEQARDSAQQQQIYVERIAQPSRPDAALEPRRVRGIAATFVLAMFSWGIVRMLIAGIKEHQS